MSNTLPIKLNVFELMLIEHVIDAGMFLPDMFSKDTGITSHRILGKEPITLDEITKLSLKVGSLLVTDKPDGYDLPLTEKETYFLREKIDLFARVGRADPGEGFTVKQKLYRVLLDFDLKSHESEMPQLALKESDKENDKDIPRVNIQLAVDKVSEELITDTPTKKRHKRKPQAKNLMRSTEYANNTN